MLSYNKTGYVINLLDHLDWNGNNRPFGNNFVLKQRGVHANYRSIDNGNRYTFEDLQKDLRCFFTDKYLRPALLPNEGVPDVDWQVK